MVEDRDHQGWVKELVKALEAGTVLDLAAGADVDVSQATNWPNTRRLPGGALRAALLEPNAKPDPRGLKIRGAYITGVPDLADLRLSFGLDFDSCAFEESADWSRLTVASLRLTDCTMSDLTLDNAHINSVVNLSGSTFSNEGGSALSLNGAEIKGSLWLKGANVTGEVEALRSTIVGTLNLRGATLSNERGHALSLDGAEIKSDAFLDPVNVTGMVRALGASIGGQLNLGGATLTNEGGNALYLDGAEIKGNLLLGGANVTGEVVALYSTIVGSLHLTDAVLSNQRGGALSLDGAEIKGDVLLDPANVTGKVRALEASIGGQLNLDGATLTSEGGDALSLDGAEIKGTALLSDLTAIGTVRAPDARFGGQLSLAGASLTNEGGDALYLESAQLHHFWLTPAAVKGRVALDAAQITVLITPNDMNVLTSGDLSASGWRLGDVRGFIRDDRQAAADWLSRDNAAREFVAQPWHELANVYERNGQPADARWMRWKAARGVTRTSPRWSKPIRWIYGALVGHGYYPLIAALWLILAIVASGIIVAANPAAFTPTATNKAASITPQPVPPISGATSCEDLPNRSSCLNPVLYAFDNALPGTLATGQAAQWTANGAQGWNMWIPYTLGGLKIASWILVALLLAGVTGLLRKT